ncbi:MAG TPA: hypothetical protein VIY68_20275 [Steroidobacteraceae bacterium]
MSTPFPPKSRLTGPSAYAPPRVRDHISSQEPPENADAPTQVETAQPDADGTEGDQEQAPDTVTSVGEPGKDPFDWLDDAIRAVVELKRASDDRADSAHISTDAPQITPMHDEDEERPPSGARRQDAAETRNVRTRPPRLETQIIPPPQPAIREGGRIGHILRISSVVAFAAIVAYTIALIYPLRPTVPQLNHATHRIAEAGSQQTRTKAVPQTPARLVVEDQQAFANDPIALAVNVDHAMGYDSLLLDGLAQGTALTAGASMTRSSWQVSPDKLAGLYLYAPRDFVGTMNTTVKLLDPDQRLLDSRTMRLKWISRPPQRTSHPAVASAGSDGVSLKPASSLAVIKPIDPSDAAMLMRRGRDFLTIGDISAARVAFQRLADAGIPEAALALANTYDPAYLTAHNVIGVHGDPAMARALYQRAKQLGSAEAGR